MKTSVVLHEEVIDYFHNHFYIPTIEKILFNLAHEKNLGSMECGKTRYDPFKEYEKNNMKLKKDYSENPNKATII